MNGELGVTYKNRMYLVTMTYKSLLKKTTTFVFLKKHVQVRTIRILFGKHEKSHRVPSVKLLEMCYLEIQNIFLYLNIKLTLCMTLLQAFVSVQSCYRILTFAFFQLILFKHAELVTGYVTRSYMMQSACTCVKAHLEL